MDLAVAFKASPPKPLLEYSDLIISQYSRFLRDVA